MIDVGRLEKVVGAGNVHHDQTTLDEYSRDMSFVHPVKPYCVVKPGNAKDIGSIVK